jgi:hypothetical protein
LSASFAPASKITIYIEKKKTKKNEVSKSDSAEGEEEALIGKKKNW